MGTVAAGTGLAGTADTENTLMTAINVLDVVAGTADVPAAAPKATKAQSPKQAFIKAVQDALQATENDCLTAYIASGESGDKPVSWKMRYAIACVMHEAVQHFDGIDGKKMLESVPAHANMAWARKFFDGMAAAGYDRKTRKFK